MVASERNPNQLFGGTGGFYTELLKWEIPKDSALQGNLNEVLNAGFRARDLVRQILTFSRHNDQEAMPMKLQPVVREALKLIRASIPTTIDIHQDINPACGIVNADSTQIHQIVMNLATNAYHSMEHSGGNLWVKINQVKSDIPVIICTGFSDQIDPDKWRDLGIQGFVSKPVVMRQIAEAIRKALDD